ncbi:MAG TPA: penicillin-binding protein 2 [Cellvibrionaceae bacterium]|nr:penicillin-binding protein 2 [Cellvibrionaceae bacterium]HMW70680.1 penicillin-binding protein 2 [Cellvibrionaceae bacterium]HNG59975.1 penicillin-binding protein 2 [Cellvibrionaceae bacterium]
MPFAAKPGEYRTFKNHFSEVRSFRFRLLFAAVLGLSLFAGLIARYYFLQVVHYEDFLTKAEQNRIQIQPVPPTRGLIYDTDNRVLADNRPSFMLTLVKERIADLDATLELLKSLIPISDADIDEYYKLLRQPRRPYEPIPLRFRLTEAEIATIAINEFRLEGVEVEAQFVRYYPYADLFAHTVGYVGRISMNDLTSFDEDQVRRYAGSVSIGKVGVEKAYEDELLGEVGARHVETNAHGRMLRVLDLNNPISGKDLHLYLDLDLQKVATAALGDNRGALVALDVETGGVLAMVSTPSYDPNLFVTGISAADYKELNTSPLMPLYNRSLQGLYPPGSTLKPMLGLGGLESGVITTGTRIYDPGFYTLPKDSHQYRDWKKGGHGGSVDLRQAITESCDTFFYSLAANMGIDLMHPVGEAFGLGEKTGIDMPNERGGNWPSKEWKKSKKKLGWFPGDSLNTSIGQGYVQATPMQLAVMTATLASRGIHRKPQLVKQIGDTPVPPQILSRYNARPSYWDYVINAMTDVVHSPQGTAKGIAAGLTYKIAAKTGTAQVVGIAQNERYDRNKVRANNRDHALFIAFAPAYHPQIALAVIVENGEHGSSAAAPIARTLFDAYFAKQAAKKTPPPDSGTPSAPAQVTP